MKGKMQINGSLVVENQLVTVKDTGTDLTNMNLNVRISNTISTERFKIGIDNSIASKRVQC